MCFFLKRQRVLNALRTDFEKIETKVKETIPILNEVIKENDWRSVKKRYIIRYANLNNGAANITSSAFLDIIVFAYIGDKKAIIVTEHINQCVKKISEYLKSQAQFKSKFHDILRNMILSFDTAAHSQNSDFKNWISELTVFALLCESDYYEILEVEKPLGNGKSADFSVRLSITQQILNFDVITYQNVNPSLHETSESINDFLNKRISNKYSEKMKGGAQSSCPEFRVLPIVEYKKGMENFDYQVNPSESLPIMAYFKNTTGKGAEYCLMDLNELCKELRSRKNPKAI